MFREMYFCLYLLDSQPLSLNSCDLLVLNKELVIKTQHAATLYVMLFCNVFQRMKVSEI